MTFTHALSTDNYGTAKFIVSANVYQGTHTTIAAALTAASSGDTIFIRPGTYTENLTLKAGVNLAAFTGDSITPNVIIIGKATLSTAGIVTISNILLQTNSDFLLAVTGTAVSVVNLYNCYLNATNNTAISFTSNQVTSGINITNCQGNLGTTGIALYAHSSAGSITFYNSQFFNSGGSSTASTVSSGQVQANFCVFTNPTTSSSTAFLNYYYCRIDTSAQNAIAVTFNGSSTSGAIDCTINSGSASCVSIGGALVNLTRCDLTSTNTNAVTGAGTLTYSPLNFVTTGKKINVTTQTPMNFGTWTPTIDGAVSGTTTYTTQAGYYTIVGNLVYIEGQIAITAATGTGNATIGGLPFTVKNLASYSPVGTMDLASVAWTWTGAGTQLVMHPVPNTTTSLIDSIKSGAAANLAMTNGAATFAFSCWYQI